jgi:HPr kinase/phosphorylase
VRAQRAGADAHAAHFEAFISQVQSFLEEALTATGSLHGVLVDVFGVGVLLLGKSGIGKSEIALDLIMRGHRLVADDIVNLTRRQAATCTARQRPDSAPHGDSRARHSEHRGPLRCGVSVRDRKKIELVIELVEWTANVEYDRLGLDQESMNVVGRRAAARGGAGAPWPQHDDHRRGRRAQPPAQAAGPQSAQEFAERLSQAISKQGTGTPSQGKPAIPGPRPTPHYEEDVE